MAEETRSLCAQVPSALHTKVRQEQEASGQTLSEYMTELITTFYQQDKEEQKTMNTETRTVGFQVPSGLFETFKAYLQRHSLKQKDFFVACIQRALADEEDASPSEAQNAGQDEWP